MIDAIGVAFVLLAQQGVLQSGDLTRLRSVQEVQVSPDGSRIAYVVESRDRPGRPYTQMFVMNVATGASSRLGSEGSSHARWSPDGRSLAYFGRQGERYGLLVDSAFVAPVQTSNHGIRS